MRRWLPLAALCAPYLFAQSPADLFEQAPPHLDSALRERVKKFYQAHVDGKFRLADQYVAEDSKDAFFEAEKIRYKSFELIRIAYSEKFTRAAVTVTCETEMLVGLQRVPVKVPLTTRWKLENGEWFWYLPPRGAVVTTPFGTMKAGEETPQGARLPTSLPDLDTLMRQVKADRTEVRLSSYEAAAEEVRITNETGGSITLYAVYNAFPGFMAHLNKTTLANGESAVLRLECKPIDKSPKPATEIRIDVEPLGGTIPIRVTFTVPPEAEAKLPKPAPAPEP